MAINSERAVPPARELMKRFEVSGLSPHVALIACAVLQCSCVAPTNPSAPESRQQGTSDLPAAVMVTPEPPIAAEVNEAVTAAPETHIATGRGQRTGTTLTRFLAVNAFGLGALYTSGVDRPADMARGSMFNRIAATLGHPLAQLFIGMEYFYGDGVQKDTAEAIEWYERAALQGSLRAQNELAAIYLYGDGVARDLVAAMKWLRLIAECETPGEDRSWLAFTPEYREQMNGEAENIRARAQLVIGNLFATGDGVPDSYVEAIKWYRLAAENGLAEAQFRLGASYASGFGTYKDTQEAIKWLRLSAEQDNPEAQNALGAIYAQGDGVPKDVVEAMKWLRLAAEQGNSNAQFNLGLLFYNGDGVPKNAVEAYMWWNLAAAGSVGNAAALRDRLARTMTSGQVAEAQERAARFRPRSANGGPDPRLPQAGVESKLTGSGFFISRDGYFVTAAHVVAGSRRVEVALRRQSCDASVVVLDEANDLALLKCEGKFVAIPVRSSFGVRRGDRAATLGFPNPVIQGNAAKFTSGTISALSGPKDDPRYFQATLPVQPGNSGGPLLDETGAAVGVVVARLDEGVALSSSGALPENVNYAVKSAHLFALLESVPALADRIGAQTDGSALTDADIARSAEHSCAMVIAYH